MSVLTQRNAVTTRVNNVAPTPSFSPMFRQLLLQPRCALFFLGLPAASKVSAPPNLGLQARPNNLFRAAQISSSI
jgi:hypothetical protein